MTRTLPRLVVFADDWGRHPSSCQHLIRHLLPRYRVDWVNTVGTHRPRPTLADLRRGLEKLRQWRHPRRVEANGNPIVHAPPHWPGFASRFERALNERLLMRSLAAVLGTEPPPVAVIAATPTVADLARRTADLNWVYYCVDDWGSWPGLDGDALARMERDLLTLVRTVVTVSPDLHRRLSGQGTESAILTHGIDLAHWRKVPSRVRERPLSGRPMALYWGLADRRLDVDVCRAVAAVADLVFVGPRGDVDGRLLDHPGITWFGPAPYAALPELAARADVLVMPYADRLATRAMQPLKLKEYLATGRPVVATPLPATLDWAAAMDVTGEPQRFAALVVMRAGRPLPAGQAVARGRLDNEGWERKAQRFEALFLGGTVPRRSTDVRP